MKKTELSRRWLEKYPWDMVVDLNKGLCEVRNAHHGPTSDGYDDGKEKWESTFHRELDLLEACTFLREMHRTAPFCFFNGNTFVTIIRNAIAGLLSELPSVEAVALRSVIGHYVAGTIGDEDIEAAIRELS